MTQTAKREDRGLFTQFPVILLDEYADQMPATSLVAFMKFYRYFGFKGIFKGSIRKLCNVLEMAKSSIQRAIVDWVRLGLVRKGEQKKADENRDEMVLLIEGNDLWKQNIEHSMSLGWCPKLGQSAPADDPTVPENKGSVPNRDKVVPIWDTVVPTLSTKSPPEDSNKITLDYLDKTEDRETPTSSSPEVSSFDSSDLNLLNSQGGATAKPSSVKGCANTEPPPIARTGQGYKTDDSDAVEKNITAEITEAQLLAWVKKAGVALGLKASCDKAVATLLPLVHGPDDITKLLKIERKIHPTGIVYIANLARPEVTQGLQESQYVPSKRGMTAVECEALMYEIWIYDADIALSYRQDDNDRWFVAIFIGEGRYKELGSPDDWPKFLSFAWLGYVAQAIQYGRDLPRQQPEQREAIAV